MYIYHCVMSCSRQTDWAVSSSLLVLLLLTEGRPRPNVRGQGRDRGQSFETETEANILALRPLWPRRLNISGYVIAEPEDNYDLAYYITHFITLSLVSAAYVDVHTCRPVHRCLTSLISLRQRTSTYADVRQRISVYTVKCNTVQCSL